MSMQVIIHLTANLHFMTMYILRISLVLLIVYQASSFVEGNCDTFTLGDCEDIDSIFYENDKVKYYKSLYTSDLKTVSQVPSSELCQTLCHEFADCTFFNFFDGVCKLYK